MSTWTIYREDKQTGIRFFLGRIEAQEPLAALRLAAQLYECDPEELVVRTFLPEATCYPLLPWSLLLDLFVEGTSAYLDACLSFASLLAQPLDVYKPHRRRK